jgi:hypothetical protein
MRRSLLLTLGHPDWWAMALAGFLVRGGIVVLALPVIAVPSLAALSTVVAPLLSGVVLGESPIPPVALFAVAAALVSAAVYITGLVGAWLEIALHAQASAALGGPPLAGHSSVREALNVRLTPHLITILALGFAVFRIVAAGYDELTSPTSSAAPLAFRILARAPEAVAGLVIAWAVAEAIGGLALRRHVADAPSRTAAGAVVDGVRGLLRPAAIAMLVVTDVVVFGLGIAVWLAASTAWTRLADRLADGATGLDLGVAMLAFLVAWLAGLLLFGVVLAWRAVAWSAASIRISRPRRASAPVTERANEAA